MCDYSLHAVANRPAELAETLVSTKFPSTTTRGFAAPDNPNMAVCLRPGTELAFENDVQTDGVIFRKKVRDRLARFRRIRADEPHQHHDALEFSNGMIVPLTDLVAGQRATVAATAGDADRGKARGFRADSARPPSHRGLARRSIFSSVNTWTQCRSLNRGVSS